MLALTDFSWRDSVQTPSDEDRKGKFVCLLFWPESQQINISRATYYRVGDKNIWGYSDRLSFEEQGAVVKAWAPVKQVFVEKQASAA